MDPLVSVVITNYNYARFIPYTIQSIVDQTYRNLEIIIVDDGSTDNSKEIIEGLKEAHQQRFQRFSTHFFSQNKGINGALHVAIKDVKTEITLIVDADDVLDRNHISKLVSVLMEEHQKDPSVTFSYCDCYLIDEKGNRIQRGLSKPFDPDLIKRNSFLPRPSPILSSVLKTFFPLPKNSNEDPKHFLWKEICAAGNKGVYVPEPLFFYRIHANNTSGIGRKIRSAQKPGNLDHPLSLSDYWPTS